MDSLPRMDGAQCRRNVEVVSQNYGGTTLLKLLNSIPEPVKPCERRTPVGGLS
jgi:hypothetical protein